MRRRWIACAVGAMALAACWGGDDDASSTTAAAEPTVASAAPTTAAPEPPPTDPPATTEAPVETTAPPTVETTAPPVETTDPPPPSTTERLLTAEERAVIEAARVSATTWFEVFRDPQNDELIQAAAVVRTGPALTRLVDRLAEVRTSNMKSAPNPEVPARVDMYEQSVRLLEGDRATVEYCYVDADFTVEIGSAPDGGDVILDDSVLARRGRSDLVRIDGAWLVESGVELSVTDGSETCDA